MVPKRRHNSPEFGHGKVPKSLYNKNIWTSRLTLMKGPNIVLKSGKKWEEMG